MTQRISTASLNKVTMRYANSVSEERANLTKQIASGEKYQTYSQMSGNIERVSGFQEKLGKIDNYISSNRTISTRLNAMSKAMEGIQKVAQEFSSDLALYNGVTSSNFSLSDSAKAALSQIEDLLNVSIGGKYLFSGSRTNDAPIDNIQAPVNTHGVPDSNYYKGDDVKAVAKIGDSYEIEYGITADDPALQELISGIRTALSGADANLETRVKQGQALVNDSIRSLSRLTAKINLDITSVENVNNQHLQLKTFWEQSLAEDMDTDQTIATTELQLNDTILRATFQAYAKISQLRLTDYLN